MVAVVGVVGSGKSSSLAGILGEMKKVSGNLSSNVSNSHLMKLLNL